MSETRKAHDRRMREGWYGRFMAPPILDVGSGTDPLPIRGVTHWDYQWVYEEGPDGDSIAWKNEAGDRDAQTLSAFPDGSFSTVYASHILEHLLDPSEALRNWWRVLVPGGFLIVVVPHRDLYEKKAEHPSRWNPHDREGGGGHVSFWLPDRFEEPHTLSLIDVVRSSIDRAEVLDFRVVDDGYDYSLPADVHPVGEYAIELVLRKSA